MGHGQLGSCVEDYEGQGEEEEREELRIMKSSLGSAERAKCRVAASLPHICWSHVMLRSSGPVE